MKMLHELIFRISCDHQQSLLNSYFPLLRELFIGIRWKVFEFWIQATFVCFLLQTELTTNPEIQEINVLPGSYHYIVWEAKMETKELFKLRRLEAVCESVQFY